MAEHIINQPLVRITIFQCQHCSRVVRNAQSHQPYMCPWGCPSQMAILRTEWEEHGTTYVTEKGKASGLPERL